MQGIHGFIDTDLKAEYINSLLSVGFNTIDFGSFVSPKAIPQMKDTADVLSKLNLSDTDTELLAIVANRRGANDAAQFEEITYLGYPFSISETFQLRNTNATIEESLERVGQIQEICTSSNKELVIYISMGFGNPYGDEWNVEICAKWVEKLDSMGIKIMALSDTIGVATPNSIEYLFSNLIPHYPAIEFGAHLHTRPDNWEEKIIAAHSNGCTRFDSTISGYGGCPMAKDDLTGNMPTENLLYYFEKNKIETGIDKSAFINSLAISNRVFL